MEKNSFGGCVIDSVSILLFFGGFLVSCFLPPVGGIMIFLAILISTKNQKP